MSKRNIENKTLIRKIDEWFKIRKDTTVIHWLYGAICGYISSLNFPCFWIGFALMCLFALDEWWNGWEEWWNSKGEKPFHGCTDWWEAFLFYGMIFFIMFILGLIIVINVRWWPRW